MRIKAPFRMDPFSKVWKVFGRQIRRTFWLRNSHGRPCDIIFWHPEGYVPGIGYAWRVWDARK